MYLYLELWKPKPAWEDLSREQREEFLAQFAPGVRRSEDLQVELLGFALNERENEVQYRYIAAWKMPNRGLIHMLEKAEEKEGWTTYFDIAHLGGRLIPLRVFANDMVSV
ncbi:MAG: hypothetical protein KDC43_21515 [Saprospiraceae bacterium]|nr:hypothetical protein [Saprospiraceae bacterium]MCB0626424.1 hypothetical protein [Saprospiraceae bacterium]MCB0676310.1 hypothetical protein [Saprospiraceae bacterium]MCB0683309.1 hypothetical protein [Saprospiraceae bacterium]